MPLAYGLSAAACLLPTALSLLPFPSPGCVRRDNNGGAQPPGPRPRLVEAGAPRPLFRRPALRRPRTALLPAAVPGGDGARAGVSLIAAPRLAASGAGGAPAGPAPAASPAAALAWACGRLTQLGSSSRKTRIISNNNLEQGEGAEEASG